VRVVVEESKHRAAFRAGGVEFEPGAKVTFFALARIQDELSGFWDERWTFTFRGD
jgi:hypothetical protein